MDDDEVMLVEAPRRIANLMSDERIFTTKSKRKRCDTWHGEENKNEQQLDPDIEQGLNTKRKFARYVKHKKYVVNG